MIGAQLHGGAPAGRYLEAGACCSPRPRRGPGPQAPTPPHFSRVSVFLEGSWKVSGESRGVDVLISLDPGEPGVSSAARGARHKLWVALAARFCFFLLLVVVVIF